MKGGSVLGPRRRRHVVSAPPPPPPRNKISKFFFHLPTHPHVYQYEILYAYLPVYSVEIFCRCCWPNTRARTRDYTKKKTTTRRGRRTAREKRHTTRARRTCEIQRVKGGREGNEIIFPPAWPSVPDERIGKRKKKRKDF